MPRTKKTISDTQSFETPIESIEDSNSASKNKLCCDDCGTCENCLHPMGNMRNYTPLLTLLLLISAFLLGMLLTKIGYLQENGASATGGTTGAAAPAVAAKPKPLHVAQAIGMDADKFKKCLDSGKYTQLVASDLADGQKAGVNGTPAIFVNGIAIVGAQPYSVFKQTIDAELASARNIHSNIFQYIGNALVAPAFALGVGGTTDTITPTDIPASPTAAPRVSVDPGTFPLLGNANAKVKIIEFADFQCPFCEQFYRQVEKNIISDYVNSGKAQFAFRNYAFLGQDSNTTAEGAYCANEQGKFWAYHNFLYEHQGQENSGAFSKQNIE